MEIRPKHIRKLVELSLKAEAKDTEAAKQFLELRDSLIAEVNAKSFDDLSDEEFKEGAKKVKDYMENYLTGSDAFRGTSKSVGEAKQENNGQADGGGVAK